MLHTINKSPYAHNCLSDCLRICSDEDIIVLIEDGVYAALADGEWAAQLLEKTVGVYIVLPDAAARGIADRIASKITKIDYAGFVQLCCEQPTIQSWY